MPCQVGRNRPSASCSAGSTSRRSAASDARRSRRRTSGSHHSRSVPPGRSSPRTSCSSRSSSRELRLDAVSRDAEPLGRLGGRERPAPAGEAREQRAQRLLAGLEERVGQPARRHRADARRGSGRRPRRRSSASRPPMRTRDRAPLAASSVSAKPASYSPSNRCAAQEQQVVQPVGVLRRAAQLAPRPPRSRPGRAGRGAPPGRAARAAGRGRATAPARGAPPQACRPRTCTSRCSRRAATRRTATRTASRSRRGRARACGCPAAAAGAPAGRRRPAGTRGRSRG